LELVSQKCREGWRYVGWGGWKSSELIRSPIVKAVVTCEGCKNQSFLNWDLLLLRELRCCCF
jgi:hypothetical protein